ncbi:hypothetical protein SK128_001784 [Halocaridina rubra]|uniref:CUB domain-containing protein n=1 Tax=Halocaridina rubra TaxID=373956 RepID=A0AAN8XR01_HALRR
MAFQLSPLGCSKRVTARKHLHVYWQSPGYPKRYPLNISCTLELFYPKKFTNGVIHVTFQTPSRIYAKNDTVCWGDRLVIAERPKFANRQV